LSLEVIVRKVVNMPKCAVLSLGLLEYGRAWALQDDLAEMVRRGDPPGILMLLEHPHVYTLGRRARRSDIFLDDEMLARLGVEVHNVDRGGEVTYHGPGQLVAYPILNLRRWGGPVKYVRSLEEALIGTLSDFGIEGHTVKGKAGVWVADEKVAFIGVRIKGGITGHGIALNVNPDLEFFDRIVPCGMPHLKVTSMAEVLGASPEMDEVARTFTLRFGQVMGLEIVGDSSVCKLVGRVVETHSV
jgi:lipoate-protein ligase B